MAARLTAYAVAFIVGVTFIAGLIVRAQREDDGPVDLIVINGKVYAGEGEELAEAVAVTGNRIVRVGTNREVQRLRRAQTMTVDARGGAVVPGFNDAHAHLISGGLSLDQIDLSDAQTIDDIKDTIRVWADASRVTSAFVPTWTMRPPLTATASHTPLSRSIVRTRAWW